MTNPTGKSPDDVKEPAPAPAPVDPAKAARERRELLELDRHDIRREGAYVQQAQGSGPVHYLPSNATNVFPSDAVLAAQGTLPADKADAFLADEKKFQRPGFVEALETRMQQETTDRKAAIQGQIDQLQAELKSLNGNGAKSSTADKIEHASKK